MIHDYQEEEASQRRSLSPTGIRTSVTGQSVKTSSEHVIGFTRLIPSFKPLAERTLPPSRVKLSPAIKRLPCDSSGRSAQSLSTTRE